MTHWVVFELCVHQFRLTIQINSYFVLGHVDFSFGCVVRCVYALWFQNKRHFCLSIFLMSIPGGGGDNQQY